MHTYKNIISTHIYKYKNMDMCKETHTSAHIDTHTSKLMGLTNLLVTIPNIVPVIVIITK